MTTTTELRRLWAPWLGNIAKMTKSVRVSFPGDGRTWSLPVADVAGPAFTAFAGLMTRHSYPFLETAGGTWVVRVIAGTNVYSLHSYGIAIDLNPSKNPFRTCITNIPPGFRADVLALRTNNDKPVFSWGGNWRPCTVADPMHFQLDCGPDDLRTGIKGDQGGSSLLPITPTSSTEDIRWLQDLLNYNPAAPLISVDGVYGPSTVAAVKAKTGAEGTTTAQKNGEEVGYRQWNSLYSFYVRRVDDDGGGVTLAQVDQKIATHAANPDAHHE